MQILIQQQRAVTIYYKILILHLQKKKMHFILCFHIIIYPTLKQKEIYFILV